MADRDTAISRHPLPTQGLQNGPRALVVAALPRPHNFLEWHIVTTIIGLSLPVQGLQNGQRALVVAALPRPQNFLEWHIATTIIGLSLPIQGLQDRPLALAVAALPRLKTLNVGHTAAGDATLGALTYAHRASAWAKEYGATLVIRTLEYILYILCIL